MKVYLASPLGFSPEWKSYRSKIKSQLIDLGCKVIGPWDPKFHKVIEEARAIQDWAARTKAFKEIAAEIGKANEEMIRSCVLFFVLKILDIEDLELIPWNIILLFSGAMSIGFCLWETGAAQWMAVNWLALFKESNWFIFVLSIAFFVMIMTNFIMNVAAIAISLPVALVIARYLSVAPEVVMFSSLVTAGMPFMLLVGAAPNAIAYDSKQFTSGEFLKYGIAASIILMVVVGLAAAVIWPLMGMPVTVK